MATLYLANQAQVVLWKHEIVGQLSDGHWENSRPSDHWRDWTRCSVALAPIVGRDFVPKRERYAVASKQLIDAVGQRMIGYVVIAEKLGEEAVDVFDTCFGYDFGCQFVGVPKSEGTYWDEQRQKMIDFVNDRWGLGSDESALTFIEQELREILRLSRYNRNSLIRDLKGISFAMRTYRTTPAPTIEREWLEGNCG